MHKDEIINILKIENENLKIQKNELLIQKDETINFLRKEVDHLKYIVNNTGSIIKSSVSALSFVVKNYNQAPVLTPVTSYAGLGFEGNNISFIENLIHEFNNDRICTYIGNFIIKTYKTDEAKYQSMWNCDTARKNYLVKGRFGTSETDWQVDKRGIWIINNIIKPIIEYIDSQIREYLENYDIDYSNDTAVVAERKMSKMRHVTNILIYLENKNIYEEVLKFISPVFYLSKVGSTISPNNTNLMNPEQKLENINIKLTSNDI